MYLRNLLMKTEPLAARKYTRAMGFIWLAIILLSTVGLATFYTFTFAYFGVPSKVALIAYIIAGFLSIFNFVAVVVGLQILYQNVAIVKYKRFVLFYNVSLSVIMLFGGVLIVLFAQNATKEELLAYLSVSHVGADTFIAYMQRKFNCCGLLPTEDKTRHWYDHVHNDGHLSATDIAEKGCHEDSSKKGCLENVHTFYDLLKLDDEARSLMLFQTLCPALLIIGVLIVVMLFNSFVQDIEACERCAPPGNSNRVEVESAPERPRPYNSKLTHSGLAHAYNAPAFIAISELYAQQRRNKVHPQGDEIDDEFLSPRGSIPMKRQQQYIVANKRMTNCLRRQDRPHVLRPLTTSTDLENSAIANDD